MKNTQKILLLLIVVCQPMTSKAFYSNIDEEFKKAEDLMGKMLTTEPSKTNLKDKNNSSSLEQSLNKILRNIQENVKRIEEESKKMKCSLLNDKNHEIMVKKTQKIFENMKREQHLIGTHLSKMENTIKEHSRLTAYTVNEEICATNHGNNAYEVKINLPGFEQKNIKVKTEEKDKNKQTLTITATKNINTLKEATQEDKSPAIQWHSEKFFSSRNINNRQQSIDYKNGHLTVILDLPSNINIKSYSMHCEKDELVITFPIEQKSDKITELKFSSTEK